MPGKHEVIPGTKKKKKKRLLKENTKLFGACAYKAHSPETMTILTLVQGIKTQEY